MSPATVVGEFAVAQAQRLGFGGAQPGVVEDGEEAAEVAAAVDRTDVGDGGEQFAGLTGVDDDAAVDDVGGRGRPPPDAAEVVRREGFNLNGVLQGAVEERPACGAP